jgi:hypothetical protein
VNLNEMRTLVRRDLKDEDNSNYRWQDSEIDRAIARALLELSRFAPRELKTAVATTAGSRDINIAALTDRVSVDRVEFPIDRTPRQFQRFVGYADTIFLTGDVEGDGTDCCVYWGKVHTLDGSTSTVPAYLEDVLALGAAAYAVLAQAQYRTDIAGIGGDRADADYQGWGGAMLKDFRAQLRRVGRSRKLKVGILYQGDDSE